MRRLTPSELGVLTDAYVELEQHLATSRRHAQRARREGGEAQAYIELDYSSSALDDLIKLAQELAPVLDRLTARTRAETKAAGRAPRLARDDGRRRGAA